MAVNTRHDETMQELGKWTPHFAEGLGHNPTVYSARLLYVLNEEVLC